MFNEESETSFPLHDLMLSVAKKMESDFAAKTALINHSLTKGEAREKVVKDFLSEYLPETYEIGTGEIVDTYGNTSQQTDLIIFDRLNCPKLIQYGDIRVYPTEGVYAVIEVKSMLDKNSLKDSILNIQKTKSLKKTAYYPKRPGSCTWSLYGKTYDYFPTMGYVFAFDSMNISALAKELDKFNIENNIPPEHQIDAICILRNGLIGHGNLNGNLVSWAEPTNLETGETTIAPVPTKHSLLLFYVMIQDQLCTAKTRPILMVKYIPTMSFGPNEDSLNK